MISSMNRRRIWHVFTSAKSRSEKHVVFNDDIILLHVSYTLPFISFSWDLNVRFDVSSTLLCHCWSSLPGVSTEGNFFKTSCQMYFSSFIDILSTLCGRFNVWENEKSVHFFLHIISVTIRVPRSRWRCVWNHESAVVIIVFHWAAQDVNDISILFKNKVCLLDNENIFHQIESTKRVVRLFQYLYQIICCTHNSSKENESLKS